MKVMFAVISCEADRARGCHDAIRNTYGEGSERTFFMGDGATVQYPDEVALPGVNDGYHFTFSKNNAIITTMLDRGCDFLFTCDVDAYLVVPRLLRCGFEDHDYVGRQCDEGHAGGGFGYFLSCKAATVLHADPPDGSANYNDMGIGFKLSEHGIKLWDRRDIFLDGCPTTWAGGKVATAHLGRGTGTWDPQWMYDCHKLYLETW